MKALPPILTVTGLPLVKDRSTLRRKKVSWWKNAEERKCWRHRTGSGNLYSTEMQNGKKKVHVYLKRNRAIFEVVYQKQKKKCVTEQAAADCRMP